MVYNAESKAICFYQEPFGIQSFYNVHYVLWAPITQHSDMQRAKLFYKSTFPLYSYILLQMHTTFMLNNKSRDLVRDVLEKNSISMR